MECTLENRISDLICQACDYPSPKFFENDCKRKDEKPKQNPIMKLLNDAKGAASRYMNNDKEKEPEKHYPNKSLEIKQKPNKETEVEPKNVPCNEPNIETNSERNKVLNNEKDARDCEQVSSTTSEAQQKDNSDNIPSVVKPETENKLEYAGAAMPSSSPPSQTISTTFKRQQSKQTEVVRKNQIEDAQKRWKDIVEFCKEVLLSKLCYFL